MSFWNKNPKTQAQEIDMQDDGLFIPKTNHTIPPLRTDSKDNVYTVGIDLEGNTILRIQADYTHMTVTLTPFGVRKMIKLLEVTLSDDKTDEDEDEYEQNDSEYNK